MKTTRIARILELVAEIIPGVHELTLLLPAFLGLHSAARAIGFDLDLGPLAVAVISVTFTCLLWIIFCSLAYNTPNLRDETTSDMLRNGDSWSASPSPQPMVQVASCTAENRPKQEADSVHPNPDQGESHPEEKHALPAGCP